jgi:hypothetical protein
MDYSISTTIDQQFAASRLKVYIDNEAVRSLRASVLGYLHEFVVLYNISQCSADRFSRLVLDVLANLTDDIFEVITLPTSRAGKYIIGLRVSRTLNRQVALCAFDLLSRHGNCPFTLGTYRH